MHGRNRKSAVFPPCVARNEIQGNLQKIIDRIHHLNADIVTLQEIDGGSIFSGGFDQFDFFKDQLKYPYAYFGPSCEIKIFGKNIFVTGNAIFSRYPLENCQSIKFNVSFPTDRMGFVIADAKLPNGQRLTITSIHLVYLDWTRPCPRAHQLRMIEKILETKKGHLILAGDFNCDLLGKESSLKDFIDRQNLKTCAPISNLPHTYPSWNPNQRIDWIFLSETLKIDTYETNQERLSDHLAIFGRFSI